ncbi:hypothetical protein ACROYT_G011693, partial [Oculina patagonica]
ICFRAESYTSPCMLHITGARMYLFNPFCAQCDQCLISPRKNEHMVKQTSDENIEKRKSILLMHQLILLTNFTRNLCLPVMRIDISTLAPEGLELCSWFCS